MKNLKLLGVLLVSFMVMGLNVFAEESEKITLEADSTTAIEVAADSRVVIDLNGKKLDVKDGHAIIINDGATVTITGNGEVNAKKAAVFNKGGNVTIENGTFSSSTWYTIKNLATMTINGGTFGQTEEKNTGNSSLIANGWYSSKDEGVSAPDKATITEAIAIMTINGGTFNHYTTTVTIKSDDWSKTTITGGNFNSKNGRLVQVTGEVLVTGGNFVGFKDISLLNGTGEEGYEPATITISGGSFSADKIAWPYTAGTVTITGGIFDTKGMVNTEKEGKDATFIITGGTFVFDVNEYLTDGLYATKTDKGYEVGKPVVESGIEVLDPEKVEEVKEVIVGVKENEKTDTILAQSILKDEKLAEKTKDISVNINVEIAAIEEDKASEEVKTAMKSIKEKAGKATVAHFFDISILVKNTNTGDSLGNVTELTEEIELMILLPENLKNTDAKLNRSYYVLREHDGKVDTIKAELSKDGKYLVFKTDKFSTYALAYEDSAKVAEKVPQTADGVVTSIIAGTIAIVSIAGICLYFKKERFN